MEKQTGGPFWPNKKTLIFMLWSLCSCKAIHSKQVATLNDNRSQTYDELVREKKLAEALSLTCSKYALDCSAIVIDMNENPGFSAVTSTLTSTITLYPVAFSYHGTLPHQGWLAAIIDHENVHRSQSSYIRHIVAPTQERVGNYFFRCWRNDLFLRSACLTSNVSFAISS